MICQSYKNPIQIGRRKNRTFNPNLRTMDDRWLFVEDDDLPQAVPVQRDAPMHPRRFRGRHRAIMEVSSPFLFDLINQDIPCCAVLSGAEIQDCSVIVERCNDYPAEVHYQCPRTGRTPLHAAALRCSCSHVFDALTSFEERTVYDANGNTPLHLLFVGISLRHLEPDIVNSIVDKLLGERPR
jgi:hypothetical protein